MQSLGGGMTKRLIKWPGILVFVVVVMLLSRLAYNAGFEAGSADTETASETEAI